MSLLYIDSLEIMQMLHLFDLSQGPARVAACGDLTAEELEVPDAFGKADPSLRCIACFGHFAQYTQWATHCKICGEHFPDGRALADHESTHALSRASYRLERLALTVNVQAHYDSPNRCARRLAQAIGELRKYFPEHQFTDPIPARMEIQKDNIAQVMLGDGYTAEYLIIQK